MDSTTQEREGASNGGMLYHEVQESKLRAVHCVNTVLQGPFFSEFDLAALASDVDRTERKMMIGSVTGDYFTEVSHNASLDGHFSIQSHWICKEYFKHGADGNDIHKTNVPHIRLEFCDMIWTRGNATAVSGLGKENFLKFIDP